MKNKESKKMTATHSDDALYGFILGEDMGEEDDLGNPLESSILPAIGHDDLFGDDLLSVTVAKPMAATGVSSMDFSMFSDGIEDITSDSEKHIKGLVYGPNGSGKTTFCGSFPGKKLILDVNEKGTKALVGFDDCKKREIETFEMFIMAYWYLRAGNHGFTTVVIDNVTNLQEIAMNHIRNLEGEVSYDEVKKSPHKGEWGNLSLVMKRLIFDFRNLPMNVIFIAQEKRNDDDDLESDALVVFPQVIKSLVGILGGAVDFIGNTYKREVEVEGKTIEKFCMRLGAGARHLAKCRTPKGAKCPGSIVNPSYKAIRKIMDGDFEKGGK